MANIFDRVIQLQKQDSQDSRLQRQQNAAKATASARGEEAPVEGVEGCAVQR